ncbi:MAG: hypothetical protein GY860_23110 [Desulfobacteraceae bacterium]|nr:hypothetical protein [Desulfobacteraceae bacterium]
MRLFNGIFNKTGRGHINQLVENSVLKILTKSKVLKYKKDGDASLEYALDWIIEDSFHIINDKSEKDVKTKFRELVSFYVVRNSRRDLDLLSGEMDLLDKEIDKCWAALKKSNYIEIKRNYSGRNG